MCNLGQFQKEQKPWNKGIKWKAMEGNKYAFKGNKALKGTGNKRAQLKFKPKPCEVCNKFYKKPRFMVRHHINFNTFDNRPSNIQMLCRKCHPKIHNRWNFKTKKGNTYADNKGPSRTSKIS